jgi:hypothetical protein
MLNDDEICRKMIKAYNDSNGNPNFSLALKKLWLDDGMSTPEQLDRCSKMIVNYYLFNGKFPDYDGEDTDSLR